MVSEGRETLVPTANDTRAPEGRKNDRRDCDRADGRPSGAGKNCGARVRGLPPPAINDRPSGAEIGAITVRLCKQLQPLMQGVT